MTTRPNPSYTEMHDWQMPYCGTVFVTWAKSRWTWDFAAQKPLAFWVNREAHYANYSYKRRMRRIARHRQKSIWLAPVTSHSTRNECISVPKWPNAALSQAANNQKDKNE